MNKQPTPPYKKAALKPLDSFVIEDGFNIREDMGDIKTLAVQLKAAYAKDPYSIPAVRGHKGIGGTVVVTDGHRKIAAAKLAGLPELPYLPFSSDILERTVAMATQNAGKDLNEMERARLIERISFILKERNADITEKEVRDFCIASIGCSQSSYYNYRALLADNVSADVQELVAQGQVSSTVVRNLAKTIKEPQDLTNAVQALVAKVTTSGKTTGKKTAKVTPKSAPKAFELLPVSKKVEQVTMHLVDSPSKTAQFILQVLTKLQDKETSLEDIVAQVNAE
jgi:ParB-like chromosome segregation protein Spo0J